MNAPVRALPLTQEDLASIDAMLTTQKRLYKWSDAEMPQRRERAIALLEQDRRESPDPFEGLV